MRFRKPKDKTDQFSRGLATLSELHTQTRPRDEAPDIVAVKELRPFGAVDLHNGVEVKPPWE